MSYWTKTWIIVIALMALDGFGNYLHEHIENPILGFVAGLVCFLPLGLYINNLIIKSNRP
jgi:hypothetical protein